MISLPISVLQSKDENFISLSTIQEHQKFCKSFLKSYHSFERKKTLDKDKTKTKLEELFCITHKKSNQEEILKWFGNLGEEERIKICTIQNKWLVNLLIQLYLLSVTYDDISLKPIYQMAELFKDNKNFEHIEVNSYNNDNSYKSNGNNYEKNNELIIDLSLYENFFSMDCNKSANIFNKKEIEKNEKKKEFIDQIKVISFDENEELDTLTLGKDLINDIEKLKYYLNLFSKDKCFQDWLLPIQSTENIYNFIFPRWMHGNENLTIFEIVAGYIEQLILLHYEYFYYSKKIYEYSYSNKIVGLYNENKELVSFVKENYSTFGNSDLAKKEFISRMEIREIVRFVKNDEKYKTKINYMKNIYDLALQSHMETKEQNILNSEVDQDIYHNLYKEMIDFGIGKVIDHLTFSNFLDIMNCRNIVFQVMRKKILDNRNDKVLKELLEDDFLSSNSNKNKKKNKKKKKKNKNNDNNEKSSDKKESNKEVKEEEKKDEIKYNSDKGKKESEKIVKKNYEIKEFLEEDKKEDSKNLYKNIDININSEKKENINIDINKKINLEKDFKNINIENDKDDIGSQISEKELSEFSDIKINEKELNKNIKLIHEENISSNKNKNKGIFLYPTNINKNTNKKKNRKKKNPCLSEKKINENKNNINKSKNSREKTSDKNSSSSSIGKEKPNNNIFINTSSSLKKEKNKNENENIYSNKSSSTFLPQHEPFSFDNSFDLSEKNNKNINIDNENLTLNDMDNLNNINNIKLEPKPINNNLNIDISSNSKIISKENIKNKSITNNDISSKLTNISFNNNFINYVNIPIISNVYTSYTPSEKFFESLTSEIKNYNTVTLNNISNLNPLKNKYLNFIENLIKSELGSKYEIKYGHYGSYFTNLSIEGSDVDILIHYKNKSSENNQDFFKDIIFILNKHENKFESVQPILTASVPVIKLQICIKNEIKDLKLEHMGYLEGYWEFDKLNFDLTFTQNEQEYLHSQQVVEYINKSLNTYPMITQLLLLLKRYFKIMKMNKSFHGGLSSYSLYLLIASFCKKFPSFIASRGKALFSFLGIFSFFEFDKLGIDIENPDIFYSLNNSMNINNYNSNDDINITAKEINIKDPLTKLNVAKSAFKVTEIQTTFRTAYDFLRTEGCYYDYAVFVYKTGYDNDSFKQIKNNYDIFETSDFKIIKKMFTLNKKRFFCDFFAN